MDKPDPPLRKRTIAERRSWWSDSVRASADQRAFWARTGFDLALSDTMIENAVGWMPVPLGVVSGLVVNGVSYEVPLATEEPSVIAAANWGASLAARAGGLRSGASDPVMRAQVFLEGCSPDAEGRLTQHAQTIESEARELLRSLEQRGGGFRGLSWAPVPGSAVLVVRVDVDVRDALGANRLNTMAEALSPALEAVTGGRKLMAILSNDGSRRTAWSELSVPVAAVTRNSVPGDEMARRVALASIVAQNDPERAVTHNKGIMNGVSALALALGNDTRALEAAAHSFAARSGTYQGLSRWWVEGGVLRGRVELPSMLSTVGGAFEVHPTVQMAWELLARPNAPQLGQIAASLGLVQNMAALLALTGEGIQRGHMGLHARRAELKKGST